MSYDKYEELKRELDSGKIFYVEFIKKNGELRKMICRRGVKVGIVPPDDRQRDATKDPDNILRVWDMIKEGYRSINLDTVTKINYDGNKIVYEH